MEPSGSKISGPIGIANLLIQNLPVHVSDVHIVIRFFHVKKHISKLAMQKHFLLVALLIIHRSIGLPGGPGELLPRGFGELLVQKPRE